MKCFLDVYGMFTHIYEDFQDAVYIVHPESLGMYAQCELQVHVIMLLQHTHFSAYCFCLKNKL